MKKGPVCKKKKLNVTLSNIKIKMINYDVITKEITK